LKEIKFKINLNLNYTFLFILKRVGVLMFGIIR
jgi:hypothetical protein